MKWNPFYNALGAIIYITIVALFMRYIESVRHDTPDTVFDGIGFLSLFVLSVAVMAFLFFFQPFSKLIRHKPAEAREFFIKTLGWFGFFTVCILTIVSLQ